MTNQAAKRIAEKAAIVARAEQFYRLIQQGVSAAKANQQTQGEFKEMLERYTQLASEQAKMRAQPTHAGESKEQLQKHLDELTEQCKISIMMAIKKDFADNFATDEEQLQRDYIENRAQKVLEIKTKGADATYTKVFSGRLPDDFKPLFVGDLEERPLKFWREWDERRSRIVGQGLGPRNLFEEQMQWTKKGMMWPYPIDNDFMSGEEENVSFADHVFLESEMAKYKLPRTGPIAQFMELVLNGLSRNPFMSVTKKREHIKWYAEYFNDALKGKYKELFA